MKHLIALFGLLCFAVGMQAASPIRGLLERIDPGASRKFIIETQKSAVDFFELDQRVTRWWCVAITMSVLLRASTGI